MVQKLIYVVDDDDGFRSSLVALLSARDFAVHDFSSVTEFMAVANDLAPGVLLLDLRMPGIGGLDFLETGDPALVRFAPIVVSGHGDVSNAVRSLKAGAVDFLEKPFLADDLLHLVDTAQANLEKRLVESEEVEHALLLVERLSPREREVLVALANGQSNKQIAGALALSSRTVEMHRANMMTKLRARTGPEATRIAALAGLGRSAHS